MAKNLRVAYRGPGKAEIAPEPASTVFQGHPATIFGEAFGAEGGGELVLTWDAEGESKTLALPVSLTDETCGELLRLVRGARLIADLEAEYDGGPSKSSERIARQLEALSRDYGLASREMALVAVVVRQSDEPGQLPTSTVVPVLMPQDVEYGSYFRHAMHFRAFGNELARGIEVYACARTFLPMPRTRIRSAPFTFRHRPETRRGCAGGVGEANRAGWWNAGWKR